MVATDGPMTETRTKDRATPAGGARDYSETSIQLKEGIEHVRARPAMYIGDIYERGLHHLVNEVVDNSVDEAMAGHCTENDVVLGDDGSISVLDNGRGIPVGIHPKVGLPTLEVCLTKLGAGGKFDKDSYKVSGGLHGVGVSCVNALAEWLEAEVYREGKAYRMRFECGQTTEKLQELGESTRRGTKIAFKPDPEIFKTINTFKTSIISKRLRELAFLNAGLKISLKDERSEHEEVFHFPRGIVEFVEELSTTEETLLSAPLHHQKGLHSDESQGTVEVEFAFTYNDTYNETILSYTNNIATIEGGTHLTGFRTALTSTLNNWLKDNEKAFKDSERPSGDDYREGLVAVISVKVPEPQFEGQTKTKLGNSDVASVVQTVVGQYLKAWWEQNPAEAKKVVNKALQARKARIAAKKAKDLVRKTKDSLRGGGVAKLKDAESNKPDECELYLVEGDSAGGTAVRARDTYSQAILPLRGKILNVWKATHDRMLSHNEIATMIQVLGTGILDEFDMSKLAYHKIIIMCDADVDGSHIRTLILTFFFRQMPDLIRAGHVYVAEPPLFKIKEKGKKRAPEEFFLDQEAFDRRVIGLGLEGAKLSRTDGKDEGKAALEGERLGRLVRITSEMTRLGREVEKKDVPFVKYLGRRNDKGQLAYASLRDRRAGKTIRVYSEPELSTLLEQLRAEAPELKVWHHTDSLLDREEAEVEVTTFTSKKKLEEYLRELNELGYTFEDFFGPESGEGVPVEPRFRVDRGNDEQLLDGLEDLPNSIRDLAQKHLDVQRYKGLGEMDADELQETTMDPKKRRLRQVTLDDMAEANRIFSVLMGTKVEPRRQFIEKHAADVSNLDV